MKDLIAKIAKEAVGIVLLRCKVESVDEGNQTCDVVPLNGDAGLNDVKLKASLDGLENAFVILPKVGSQVVVGLVDGTDTDAFVLVFSEYDRIQFGDGSNEGLVKLPVLQNEVAKNSAILDAMMQVFTSTWIVAPSDGGAALKASMSAALAGKQTADLSSAGNEKITH